MFHYSNEGAEKNEFQGHFQRVKRNHWGRFVDSKNVLAYTTASVFGDGLVGGSVV